MKRLSKNQENLEKVVESICSVSFSSGSIERLAQKNTERLTRILSFKRNDDKLIELQSKYNLIEFV